MKITYLYGAPGSVSLEENGNIADQAGIDGALGYFSAHTSQSSRLIVY